MPYRDDKARCNAKISFIRDEIAKINRGVKKLPKLEKELAAWKLRQKEMRNKNGQLISSARMFLPQATQGSVVEWSSKEGDYVDGTLDVVKRRGNTLFVQFPADGAPLMRIQLTGKNTGIAYIDKHNRNVPCKVVVAHCYTPRKQRHEPNT